MAVTNRLLSNIFESCPRVWERQGTRFTRTGQDCKDFTFHCIKNSVRTNIHAVSITSPKN
jgi:hypothetical protein